MSAKRLHDFLNNTHADAGQFFCKRLRVWHRQARASCRSSFDSRGTFLCNFAKLGRLLQLGHVATCHCSQHVGGRGPVFSQAPPRVAPASARSLPLLIQPPWPNSLRSRQAGSVASNMGHVGPCRRSMGRARARTPQSLSPAPPLPSLPPEPPSSSPTPKQPPPPPLSNSRAQHAASRRSRRSRRPRRREDAARTRDSSTAPLRDPLPAHPRSLPPGIKRASLA